MPERAWIALAALSLAAAASAQDRIATSEVRGRLREIRVVRADVFDEHTGHPLEALESLVNTLHATTREHVIRREMWFAPGEQIDDKTAAEFERNLRALGLFAEATVQLVPTGTPGEYDLVVTTRDRLSLNFGAGASYVGGVGGVRGSIGESNFLGLGDRIALAYAGNSENEYRGSFNYTDLHVFDTWHTASVQATRTDEGDSYAFALTRPFKHLLDPRAYGARIAHSETEIDYYRLGESVAEVPDTENAFTADMTWASGPREHRRRLGFLLQLEQHDYEPAHGPLAPEIRVPGDTTSVFFGPTVRWQDITGFRKVEGLDTLLFVQDLQLGTDFAITAGGRWRDEEGIAGDLQPELRVFGGWASEPLGRLFTNTTASGSVRWDGGDAVGWHASIAGRAFVMLDDSHTIGFRAAFDAVEETQDLPIELTLDEDSGLRGYRARLFNGTRRAVMNVEHRFDTGIEFLTMRFGTVAFFDAGQMGTGGEFGDTYKSAGVGLRIGSKRLLGSNVLRIDLAKPLDRVPGEDDGWLVSVTIGQVFTFGG